MSKTRLNETPSITQIQISLLNELVDDECVMTSA